VKWKKGGGLGLSSVGKFGANFHVTHTRENAKEIPEQIKRKSERSESFFFFVCCA
jgi:hypothetical protein